MATSEALIKYYDCLKDSFNKIQDKHNKTALINAALRPKIREEFEKSEKVLNSYLNYIQVFSLIYIDKFGQICNNIIVPLLKDYQLIVSEVEPINNNNNGETNKDETNSKTAAKIHETIKIIIKSRPELADEFVNCVVRVFPSIYGPENPGRSFKIFLTNCLELSTYLDHENLMILISKVFDKLDPPNFLNLEPDELDQIKITLFDSYEYVYEHIDRLKNKDNHDLLDSLVTTTGKVFVRDFISCSTEEHFKYMILYIHSLDIRYSNSFIELLWKTFLDPKRSFNDRIGSITYASAFISRANYVTLDKLIEYLQKTCKWCSDRIKEFEINQSIGEDVESSFYTLTHSIFYIITQRYREMYEHETIEKLLELNLDQIIQSPLRPLEVCDFGIEERFKEVSTLYRIADINFVDEKRDFGNKESVVIKKRKSESLRTRLIWKPAYREDGLFLPDRIKPLYRKYYHHKFFTITRDE